GTDGEPPVEVVDESLLEIAIGCAVAGDVVQTQLLRESALDGAEAALGTAAGLWRHRPQVLDAEGAQDASDLSVLLVSGSASGSIGPAEVTAPVSVQLAEPPVLLQNVQERRHRRCDP